MAGTDQKHTLIDQVASYALDPLGFVVFAFPWGEPGTELANSTGPRDWQRELLAELGRRLREGYQLGKLLPILMARASGHGVRKSTVAAWITLWGLFDAVEYPRRGDGKHRLTTAHENMAGGYEMAPADDQPRLVQGDRNCGLFRRLRARAAVARRRNPMERREHRSICRSA